MEAVGAAVDATAAPIAASGDLVDCAGQPGGCVGTQRAEREFIPLLIFAIIGAVMLWSYQRFQTYEREPEKPKPPPPRTVRLVVRGVFRSCACADTKHGSVLSEFLLVLSWAGRVRAGAPRVRHVWCRAAAPQPSGAQAVILPACYSSSPARAILLCPL